MLVELGIVQVAVRVSVIVLSLFCLSFFSDCLHFIYDAVGVAEDWLECADFLGAHVTKEMNWRIGVKVFQFAQQLFFANLFDVFENRRDLLRLNKVVLALIKEQTTNLIIVVWNHFAEFLLAVIVAFFTAHLLQEFNVEPVRNLHVTLVTLLEVDG